MSFVLDIAHRVLPDVATNGAGRVVSALHHFTDVIRQPQHHLWLYCAELLRAFLVASDRNPPQNFSKVKREIIGS